MYSRLIIKGTPNSFLCLLIVYIRCNHKRYSFKVLTPRISNIYCLLINGTNGVNGLVPNFIYYICSSLVVNLHNTVVSVRRALNKILMYSFITNLLKYT